MGKWKDRYQELAAKVRAQEQAPVTYRTLSVDFEARTVSIDGRTIHVPSPAINLPILSSDEVVIDPRTGAA